LAREDANNITSFERVVSDKIFEFSAIRIQELPMIAMFVYQIKMQPEKVGTNQNACKKTCIWQEKCKYKMDAYKKSLKISKG
jgi:hypothetical protein